MLSYTFKIASMGGKAAALGTLLATTALAQTVVETPAGNTVVVTDPSRQAESSVGAVTPPDFPLPEQLDNDMAVSEALVAQGFTDIRIERDGPIMTVRAQRNGVPTVLVYSIANSTLISVDGVEMRAEIDTTSSGQTGVATEAATDDEAPAEDDGVDDAESETDADTGLDDGDTGTDDGDSGDTGAGADAGADAGAGAGSDGGADAGTNGGADSDTDGGADTGSDGDSDSGSDTGSDTDG